MDIEALKSGIIKNVYHIDSSKNVALHKHSNSDEIFYCVKGHGFGILENSEVELTVGNAFIVPAGTMHSLRTDSDLFVASFLIPVIKE